MRGGIAEIPVEKRNRFFRVVLLANMVDAVNITDVRQPVPVFECFRQA